MSREEKDGGRKLSVNAAWLFPYVAFSPTLALLLKDSTLAEDEAGLLPPEQEASGV